MWSASGSRVAGGYFLGRTKKMKLALMLGGMAAGRQAGGPGQILAQGSKLLSASPELSALTEQVRGRLIEAGKGAMLVCGHPPGRIPHRSRRTSASSRWVMSADRPEVAGQDRTSRRGHRARQCRRTGGRRGRG